MFFVSVIEIFLSQGKKIPSQEKKISFPRIENSSSIKRNISITGKEIFPSQDEKTFYHKDRKISISGKENFCDFPTQGMKTLPKKIDHYLELELLFRRLSPSSIASSGDAVGLQGSYESNGSENGSGMKIDKYFSHLANCVSSCSQKKNIRTVGLLLK